MNDINALPSESTIPVLEKPVWGFWPTAGLGAVVLVVFVVVQILILIIAVLFMVFPQIVSSPGPLKYDDILNLIQGILGDNLGLLQSIATISSGIICIGLLFLIIKARQRAGIAEYLGLNKISVKAVLAVLGVVMGFIVLADGLMILLGNSTNEQIMFDIYHTSIWPPVFWIAVVIFAPLFEEAFFRGFLFEGFRQSRVGLVGAIGITSLAWALIHSFQYSIASIAWIFVLGIIMGIVRGKTKTLWSTLIMHASVNLVATLEVALDVGKYLN